MGIVGRLTRYGTSCPYSSPWVVLCHLANFCGMVGLLFHSKQCCRRPERDVTSLGLLPSLEYCESLFRSHPCPCFAPCLPAQGNKSICSAQDNVIGSSSPAMTASKGSSSQDRMWYLCADSGMLKPFLWFFLIQEVYRMPCVFGAENPASWLKLAKEAILYFPALVIPRLAGEQGGGVW